MNKLSLEEIEKIVPGPEPEIDKSGGFIPVCEPTLLGNELKYVENCVRSNWISSIGDYIEKFEDIFAKAHGAKYGVACSTGTAALHLALEALEIGEGDEVIIPTFTMIATANAVSYTGAKPVLVDSELGTWNMDVSKIEEKITKKTKAIMPVHTYGHPVDMDKVLEIAKKYSLFVVEDAAEAHGAEYKGRKIGSISDISCFSFYGNKIITTGEGGMVTTNNKELADRIRGLRSHDFSKERHFWHKRLGFGYRMTNMQAALGLAQMERFEELVSARRKNARLYNSLLQKIKGVVLPPEADYVKNVFWMYGLLIDDNFDITRDQLREELARKGIETRTFFIPVHFQPLYYENYDERFPMSEELCKKGLYLPSSSSLAENQIHYISECINEISKK